MTHVTTLMGLALVGVFLLALQPGGIVLGYAAMRRHRRGGGNHPVLVALAGWLAGCLLTSLCLGPAGAALGYLDVDSTWLLLLVSYLPVWLLAWLLVRPTSSAGHTVASDNGPKGEDND